MMTTHRTAGTARDAGASPHLAACARVFARSPIVVGALVYAVAFCVILQASLQVMSRISLTGDEPWYILQALSLLRYHSVDVTPLLHNHAVYDPLVRHWDDHTRDYAGNGEHVLPNLPGYAAIIAPWYQLGGHAGIVVFQVAVSALTATLIFDEARRMFASPVAALFALLAYLLALPALLYAEQAFPSTVASGVAFLAFVLAARTIPSARGWHVWLLACVTGLLVAALPWIHFKYALAAMALVGVAALALHPPLRHWRALDGNARRAWAILIIIAGSLSISLLLISLYSSRYFGVWTPQYSSVPNTAPDFAHPNLQRLGILFWDVFFDPQSGLLPWVPLYFLVPLGLALLWRRQRRCALMLLFMLVGFLSAFLPALVTNQIVQGYALPSRFSVECAPYLTLAVAAVFAATKPRRWLLALRSLRNRAARAASPRMPWARVATQASIGLLCIALLATAGWFTIMGVRDPELLYHSLAGPRLVEKYPQLLPAWWFGLFPPSTGPLDYQGAMPLIAGPASSQRSALAQPIPPGAYIATFHFACMHAAPARLRLAAEVDIGTHATVTRPLSALRCQQPGMELPTMSVPFVSAGYEPVSFLTHLPEGAPLLSVIVTFAPTR
jgi:hypothetical protein